nr:DUF1349 domain-containing protein [Galbitalea soli]
MLSARVTVDFAGTFDAGVLCLWESEECWAKLCFEYSPRGQPMVVSVVTRGHSDDANAIAIDSPRVWLRVARICVAYAFHYSTDGVYWHFVRLFRLGDDGRARLGMLAQAPVGEGCTRASTTCGSPARPPGTSATGADRALRPTAPCG